MLLQGSDILQPERTKQGTSSGNHKMSFACVVALCSCCFFVWCSSRISEARQLNLSRHISFDEFCRVRDYQSVQHGCNSGMPHFVRRYLEGNPQLPPSLMGATGRLRGALDSGG